MAQNDLVAQFARKPPAVQAGIFLGVIALLGLIYWQFFYSALADDKQAAINRNGALQKENDNLKKSLAKWEQLMLEKDALDEVLRKNQVSLPASSELPAFFVHLQRQAAASGVNIKSWKRIKESPIESYVKVPVAIEVTGSFYEINKYFYLLYQTDRIITVENFTLGGAAMRNDDIHLTASFTASTFRLADVPPDTSLPDEDTARSQGAKAAVEAASNKSATAAEQATGGDAVPATEEPPPGQPGGGDSTAAGVDRLKDPAAGQ
jgi:type IV pilus assembly protein PilO